MTDRSSGWAGRADAAVGDPAPPRRGTEDGYALEGADFLFESSWKKPYSTRGVRALLARYAARAGLEHNMPPHRLRHVLFTWLKTQGVDDALIQPYSGHASRTSLEVYSRVALADAQESYDKVIERLPV